MKKKLIHIFLFSSFLVFQSCEQKSDPSSYAKPENQELKILLTDPVETLDPLQILYSSDWKVATNIFESLVSLNENGKVVPELAESFSISEDRLKYIFKLRNNVYFQDNPCFNKGIGRKLNSYDIKYTFERLANPKNNFPNWQMISDKVIGINKFHNGENKSIEGIVIEDSLTLSFLLAKPSGTFLKILATPNYCIIPKEAVEYFGVEFKYHPVGTGPFRISEFRKYEKVQLVKNDNYYLMDSNKTKLPHIKSICYSTIGESENIIDELFKKSTHIINVNNKDFQKLEKSELLLNNFQVITLNKGESVRYWGFNFSKNGNNKNNKFIRTAIAKSFNRKLIIDEGNLNKLAESLVPIHLLNDNKFEWHQFSNILYSNKLYSDSLVIFSNIVTPDLIELEKAITKVGIPTKRIIKKDNYYRDITKLKPDLFRVSMFPSYPDPIEYYSLFYSKSSIYNNFGRFNNKEYDRLYEKILYELNDSILVNYYTKLEEILKQEVAAIYLTHQGPSYYILPQNLKNIKLKYVQLDFRKAYFE
ncbi:MAG: ABC transporter substrate-binding protein [Ignavibacteriae bacterium]|nr:ABC transporter substrate-binding protein [Ignavibacteriota bacterium]